MERSANKVLLVEDTDSLREVLQSVLEGEGYNVEAFSNAEDAVRRIESGPDFSLVLSDFKLPGMNGLDLLRVTRAQEPTLPFLVMTAYGSIDVAVEAMKCGANDFICKPFEPQAICDLIHQVIEHKQVRDRNSTGKGSAREILTRSPVMQSVLAEAKRAARFSTPVLLLGESGVGKELFAKTIHFASERAEHQFVSVNCAAMPAQLLESEFFGHESGAFTGATQARVGLFEYATKGTIFLDEVGEMPPHLQVKLLRALQEGEIKRVGGNKSIKVAPRIIAATNQSITTAIADGRMREDFYYRLAVVEIAIPPLRERVEDILFLAEEFIRRLAISSGRSTVPVLTETAKEFMTAYHWPGNVRELENVIERALIMSRDEIDAMDLGIEPLLRESSQRSGISSLPEVASAAAKEAEIDMIRRALRRTDGNKSNAAKLLSVSYKTLLNKIRDYEIDSPE